MSSLVNKVNNYQGLSDLVKENEKEIQDPLNLDLILIRSIKIDAIEKFAFDKYIPFMNELVEKSVIIKPQNRLLFYQFLCNNKCLDENVWKGVFRDIKKFNILKSDNMVFIMNCYSFIMKNNIKPDYYDYSLKKILKQISLNQDYLKNMNFYQSISLLNGFSIFYKNEGNVDREFFGDLKNHSISKFEKEFDFENNLLIKELFFDNENGFDITDNILNEITRNYQSLIDIDKNLVKTVI